MIDIGINLTNGQFRKDQAEVIQRAASAGLSACVLTGTDLESSSEAIMLCRKYRSTTGLELYSTAGVHPHDADSYDSHTSFELSELLQAPEVVAVGETGLDFNRNYSSRDNQIAALHAQLELAREYRKPLFLHERDAFDTQSSILREHLHKLPPAVIHCFTGSREQLVNYLDMGLYIGITGWICDPERGEELREIVSLIPEDRLMIETDAPFLLPKNIQPKPESRRNEPAMLRWVADMIASCTKRSEESIRESTSINARAFFNLS